VVRDQCQTLQQNLPIRPAGLAREQRPHSGAGQQRDGRMTAVLQLTPVSFGHPAGDEAGRVRPVGKDGNDDDGPGSLARSGVAK
jgi:hypothetical protein